MKTIGLPRMELGVLVLRLHRRLVHRCSTRHLEGIPTLN